MLEGSDLTLKKVCLESFIVENMVGYSFRIVTLYLYGVSIPFFWADPFLVLYELPKSLEANIKDVHDENELPYGC